jgi:hypothetical protein
VRLGLSADATTVASGQPEGALKRGHLKHKKERFFIVYFEIKEGTV